MGKFQMSINLYANVKNVDVVKSDIKHQLSFTTKPFMPA